MKRRSIEPRAGWQATAEAHGFTFHSPGGTLYWDESHFYELSLDEVEAGLEAPAAELEEMCLEIAARVVSDDGLMRRLRLPEHSWDYVARSWHTREPRLYGRLDLAFSGTGPAKLYEYNADTPTSLYESAVFQWLWLEEMRERGRLPGRADQFNSLHERLVAALPRVAGPGALHLAAVGASAEDMGTIAYLADCAAQAGLVARTIAIEDIGVDARGRFTDLDDQVITTLFKLYPWEWLLADGFARHIPGAGCRILEPAWKTILSNKGLMALLWEAFPGHPNLLPSYFEDDPRVADLGSRYVRKPLLSREGANIEIHGAARAGLGARSAPPTATGGPYGAEGHIVQAYHPLPTMQGCRPLCGVWLVEGQPAGLGMREGDTDITTDAARFVPHVILG